MALSVKLSVSNFRSLACFVSLNSIEGLSSFSLLRDSERECNQVNFILWNQSHYISFILYSYCLGRQHVKLAGHINVNDVLETGT